MIKVSYDGAVALSDYLQEHRAEIKQELCRSGAMLFCGPKIASVEDFAKVRDGFVETSAYYHEPSTPRSLLGNGVYTSTDFPSARTIALHNEMSYAQKFPRYVMLACLTPPKFGGSTPIADVRAVLRRLPDDLIAEFEARKCAVVRNYGTGERSWFNHVCFWHPSRLDKTVREALTAEFGDDGLPFNTTYGDGTTIPDDVIGVIAAAYEAEKIVRPWAAGEVVILDNFLVAHGREPYEGERRVIVAMGDEYTRED